jgi:hypothetical protein
MATCNFWRPLNLFLRSICHFCLVEGWRLNSCWHRLGTLHVCFLVFILDLLMNSRWTFVGKYNLLQFLVVFCCYSFWAVEWDHHTPLASRVLLKGATLVHVKVILPAAFTWLAPWSPDAWQQTQSWLVLTTRLGGDCSGVGLCWRNHAVEGVMVSVDHGGRTCLDFNWVGLRNVWLLACEVRSLCCTTHWVNTRLGIALLEPRARRPTISSRFRYFQLNRFLFLKHS